MKFNEDVDKLVKEAGEADGYLLSLTTKKIIDEKNNRLDHYLVRENFETKDIVPSFDATVRSLGIHQERPTPTASNEDIDYSLYDSYKPLKIAIITHFNRCPDYYSPGRAVKNQIKILQKFGHEVVFFVQEGSTMEVDCEIRKVIPKFKREKNVVNEEVKGKMVSVLREQLTGDFDIAITHDLYIDDCITYREAIKECGVDIQWLHWARSGVGEKIDFDMPNTRYVYMNHADKNDFADAIGVDRDRIRVVFNEKDPSLFFDWHNITKSIVEGLKLSSKEFIQVFPVCSTRLDAKGVNSVIQVFAELKRQGNEVALIIVNANAKKQQVAIDDKMRYAMELGLTTGDILFTSELNIEGEDLKAQTPYRVVRELFQISNLFVFPTKAEVSSNILLEASMTKNLLVLNEDLYNLFDFADNKAVLSYPFGSDKVLKFQTGEDELKKLVKQIVGELMSNKADRQFRHVWKNNNIDAVYYKQLAPVLYENNIKK
jgi:glycosyltransferase involved in cell wall biosynthesis